MTKKLSYLFVSAGVFAVDQWTKWMVEIHLPHHASTVLVPGFFNLTHVRNTGVAFGLFASTGGGSVGMLTALGLVALTAVGLYFWHAPHRDRSLLVALALVVGGALGNLADRITSGAVTDFIDLYRGAHHWPSFNVADTAISIGILVMALDGLRHRPHVEAALKSPAPAPEA
jgi:signal peptidase II